MLILPAYRKSNPIKPAYGTRINKAHPLASGLSGAWLENESGGTKLYDISGKNNTGTIGSGATWSRGQFGPCLSFNNTSTGNVTFGSPQTLATPAMSLACWVKATAFSNSYNTVIGRDGPSDYVQIWVNSTGKLVLYVTASSGIADYNGTGTFTLSTGQWYLLVLTYNSISGLKGYVNGVLDGSAAANGTITTTLSTFAIGVDSNNSGRYWNGLLDVPLAWNRALSAAEVKTLYADPFCFMRQRRNMVIKRRASFNPSWATRSNQAFSGSYY